MGTRRYFFLLSVLISFLPSFSLAVGLEAEDTQPASRLDTKRNLREYDRCDWLVTYRNRTYDLAPLTRASLGHPIEGDIRAVIRRVPEASAHLDNVEREAKLSKVYSMVGSAGVTALVASRFLRSDPKIKANENRVRSLDLIGLTGAILFIKSAIDSHFANRAAKEELASAIEAFNQNSTEKIEPRVEEPL